MLTNKSVNAVILAVATLSINASAAPSQDNPLHPAYYAERVTSEFNIKATERYVDTGNPLRPAYAKTSFSTDWVATGSPTNNPYVDARNPLHPTFKRF